MPVSEKEDIPVRKNAKDDAGRTPWDRNEFLEGIHTSFIPALLPQCLLIQMEVPPVEGQRPGRKVDALLLGNVYRHEVVAPIARSRSIILRRLRGTGV